MAETSSLAFAKRTTGGLREADGERAVRVARLVLRGGDLVHDGEPGTLLGVPLLGQRSSRAVGVWNACQGGGGLDCSRFALGQECHWGGRCGSGGGAIDISFAAPLACP